MGRAIDNNKKLAEHDLEFLELKARVKFLEDRLAELMPKSTMVHHVDLHDDVRTLVTEGVNVEPDTPPTKKSKKAKATA